MINFEFRHPDVDKIIHIVCERFNVSFAAITGKSRKQEFVDARYAAYYLIKMFVDGISLKRIGYHFDNRDHSSVIHGLSDTEYKLERDELYVCKIYDLKLTIKSDLQIAIANVIDSDFREEESYETPDAYTFWFLNKASIGLDDAKNQL